MASCSTVNRDNKPPTKIGTSVCYVMQLLYKHPCDYNWIINTPVAPHTCVVLSPKESDDIGCPECFSTEICLFGM